MDTTSPSAAVTKAETREQLKRYTVYKLVVSVDGGKWFVFRRYSEFYALYEALTVIFPKVAWKLPGKRLIGNLKPEVVHERRIGLHKFVQQVLSDPEVCKHPIVKDFFSVKTGADSVESEEEDQWTNKADPNNGFKLGDTELTRLRPSDFQFRCTVGKGSFGKVYLASYTKENKLYAIKVLNKASIKRKKEVTHIMNERNVLVKHVKHPFLVNLHYSFQTKDKLYFVMDYINGGELFFHLQRERTFPECRTRFYAAEIASALGYLHSKDIVYRDLKPENLLLDHEGHIVLTDFGLCKEGINAIDTAGTFCGTPEYLAPEVIKKERYGKAVDWWCLGCVIFEMLFGLPPFYCRDHKKMYDNILYNPLRFFGRASYLAKDLLTGLLCKEPECRLGAVFDVEELKSNPFFLLINWEDLEARKIPAPFRPKVSGDSDLQNIDRQFLKEPVSESVGKEYFSLISASVEEVDDAFLGFSYAPPFVDNENWTEEDSFK